MSTYVCIETIKGSKGEMLAGIKKTMTTEPFDSADCGQWLVPFMNVFMKHIYQWETNKGRANEQSDPNVPLY